MQDGNRTPIFHQGPLTNLPDKGLAPSGFCGGSTERCSAAPQPNHEEDDLFFRDASVISRVQTFGTNFFFFFGMQFRPSYERSVVASRRAPYVVRI